MRERGVPISGPLLQAKALQFHKVYHDGPANFSASSGWLSRWKKQHEVRQLTVCGEALSSREDLLPTFFNHLQKIIEEENLSFHQIYNADETGLNFKRLPNKTLAARTQKKAPGYKESKERVTLLACANASGRHKLPLFLIGKSKNPRALKNVHIQDLPVKYGNQESAWMTRALFKEWFFQNFVPEVRKYLQKEGLPEKALLILDNAPVHPEERELLCDGIRLMFLPPSVTSTIQPMDQNVLEVLKKNIEKFSLNLSSNKLKLIRM
ncbi:jerky protein homolog-like [Phlebotomus papatasi]|uniref:jerky protein homolog-like n=1 Tax=Phlebotomus papatasi TaxID=29031 RepID=UPI0024846CF0|nr:jerky protein homolog-like [Phlebotomus papatasi]